MNNKFDLYDVMSFVIFLVTLIILYFSSPFLRQKKRFEDSISQELSGRLGDITIDVYERDGVYFNASTDAQSYRARLIIVRPVNWYIYTNDGLRFYYFTNQTPEARNCQSDRVNGVEYRLETTFETSQRLAGKDTALVNLRQKCLNNSLDQFVRIFGPSSNAVSRTSVDVTDYYAHGNDTLRVDSVINVLLQLLLV